MIAALATALLLLAPMLGAWVVATRASGDWRLGLGLGALAWAMWAVAASELLSLGAPHAIGEDPGHLTGGWLIGVWTVPALASCVVLLHAARGRARWWRTARARATGASTLERVFAAGIGACLALTLLVAVVSAPNNWDSMTYHLARVEAWSRLGGIAHYATSTEPQLYQPPGAEILIAQGTLISGGDRLAALVQWWAYAGCIALAAAAVAALGGGRRAQLGAGVLTATIPTAILEATSTQNDLLLAAWLLLAGTLAAHVWCGGERGDRWHRWAAIAASAAIGMAVLTKGTGLMFALPVGVFLAVATARRLGLARAALLGIVGLALVGMLNVGQWSRNHETFGSFVSAGSGLNDYRVVDPSPRSLASNLARNATNHLDAPIPGWNSLVDRGTRRVLGIAGIDPDDPRTTFKAKPFRVGPFGPHEDHAGSLLLLVLGAWAAAAALVALARRRANAGLQVAWLLVIAAQVLLFSALVTWQNWHVRLHLPLTVAVVPLVAVRLAALRSSRWLTGACIVGVAMAPVFLLFNVTRPLVGEHSILTNSRIATYFVPRPQLEAPYREAVARIARAGTTEAGMVTTVDDWQYPLAVIGAHSVPEVRFREVLAAGPSTRYASVGAFAELPDAVVCVSCPEPQRQQLSAAGLANIPLDAGGVRTGRGDDIVSVELWMRPPA